MAFIHDFGKLLECPVCFEIFDNPKSLWCGHTLCYKCFNQLISYNAVQCPLCRIQTRCVRNGPPSLYIVRDFILLFNKERESQKYLSAIMPKLPKKLPAPNAPPAVFSAAAEDTATCSDKYLSCLDCNVSRDAYDIWVCSECNYRTICSRCGLLKHAGHAVELYTDLMERRKLGVAEWREIHGGKLDMVYKNRIDIEFNETRIKFLRLQFASKTVSPAKGESILLNLNEIAVVGSKDADHVDLDEATSKAKKNFTNLRDRLTAATAPAFLSGSEENFANELRSLPTIIDGLKCEQEIVLKKQKLLQDELSEVLGLNPKPTPPVPAPGPKRMMTNYQGRRPYYSGGQHPNQRGYGSLRTSANSNRFR